MDAAREEFRWAEFASRDDEVAYRRYHRVASGRLTALALVATSMLVLLNVRNDFLLATDQRVLVTQLLARTVSVALGLSIAVHALRTDDPMRLERATVAWIVVTLVTKSYVLSMRPPDYYAHIASDIVFLVVTLLILPIAFRFQVASMLAYAAADLAIAVFFRNPMGRAAALSTAFTYALAMTLGTIASYRMQMAMRRAYVHLRSETRMRESLEKALAEIRTLRGVIPICSSCHDIRDEQGAWHTVEVYVQEHTHADFTHGMCPSCVRKLYPEIADDVLAAVALDATAGAQKAPPREMPPQA